MTPSTHLIRILFNINAVQYQAGPIHESDKHIFAKFPGGGGGGFAQPTLDPRMRLKNCICNLGYGIPSSKDSNNMLIDKELYFKVIDTLKGVSS